jgi:hypothetical protein
MVQGDAAGGGPAHFHRFSQDDGQRSIEIKMGHDGPCGSEDVAQAGVHLQDPHDYSFRPTAKAMRTENNCESLS